MPLKDVNITLNIKKAARLTGLGKPLILARKTGASTFTNYAEPEDVAAAFGADSVAHKLATVLLKQGDTSPATLAIATYDPDANDGPSTAAEALTEHFDKDFYFVTADTQVVAEVKAVADVVEGEGFKLFGTTLTSLADLQTLATNKYDRTFAIVHTTVGEYPAEALIGGHGSKTVGTITYKDKKLVGITPQDFNAARLGEIETLFGFAYVTKSGDNVTSEGTLLSGEYIDVIHGKDWIKVNGEAAIQKVFTNNDKVGYDDPDIPLLATALENVLIAATTNRIIARDENNRPLYQITIVPRAQTNPADRAARVYKGLSFSLELAGAIHSANVKGDMIV